MNDIRKYFKYLYSLERTSMKYDLSNISQLLKAIGSPHLNTKFIHIAGTNGKGGTASFLASILIEHGLKTGLFTSPHILRFNERIRINGKAITDSFIKRFLDTNKKIIEKIKPSFFEVNTAIAFKYFADMKVDIAVIEAGLGGRLDSTNIVTPELIIITQIAIDHTDYLGNTLKKIAKEKLGIVKPGIDVIVTDTSENLKKLFISKIKPGSYYFLDDHINISSIKQKKGSSIFEFKGLSINKPFKLNATSPLPVNYQARNIAGALLSADKFLIKNGLKLNHSNVKRAIKNVKSNSGYRCRLETIKKGNLNYILDISHNPAGIKTAIDNLNFVQPEVIVFAIMNDKDYRNAIDELLKTNSAIVFTQPKYKRAIPAAELFRYAGKSKYYRGNKIYCKSKVPKAVEQAKDITGKKGNVLIIGSFFLISEAIKALKIQKLFK